MSYLLIFLPMLVVLFILFTPRGLKPADLARLERIEHKLDLVMAQLGVVEPPLAGEDEIVALLRDGKRIPAIKMVRQRTGMSLVDAKNWTDAKERELLS